MFENYQARVTLNGYGSSDSMAVEVADQNSHPPPPPLSREWIINMKYLMDLYKNANVSKVELKEGALNIELETGLEISSLMTDTSLGRCYNGEAS